MLPQCYSELHPLVTVPTDSCVVASVLYFVSLCHLFPGYGMGTPYTWVMGKCEAGSLARKTFLTFSLKNRHGMAFPFSTIDVLKM